MKLNNKVYDVMKWLVIIVLPAVATLYAALAAVWAWPYADEVVTTITAVDTFLGAVLCISTATYNKGARDNG
nr:MAG TPA: holin [Caudoviricetes sp.]